VALLEKFEELVGTISESSHFIEITHEREGGEHIVGVLRSSGGFDSPVDDIFGLLDGELRTLDVVGEVRIVEGEDAGLERSGGMVLGSGCLQCGDQDVASFDSFGVVGNAERTLSK
jgi:hypothetical protein